MRSVTTTIRSVAVGSLAVACLLVATSPADAEQDMTHTTPSSDSLIDGPLVDGPLINGGLVDVFFGNYKNER